jgi:hypothetical protein
MKNENRRPETIEPESNPNKISAGGMRCDYEDYRNQQTSCDPGRESEASGTNYISGFRYLARKMEARN